MSKKRKKILFVDDDVVLLELVREMMEHFSKGGWEVLTAADVSRALGLLQEHRVDLLVLDIHMPLVDGLQFLNLLGRKYPNVLKVVLTGDPTENHRTASLSNGAELFLEKPRDQGGWETVYATLHELSRFQPEEGFRGVLRRVGLQDVLQMECLARSSSLLQVHAGAVHGAVYVKAGQIIHAECGARSGEEAFNYLMGLPGGEFDVQPFSEPPVRSITGSWEFLLMEAARKRDERGAVVPDTSQSDSGLSVLALPPPGERSTQTIVPLLDAPSTPSAGRAETRPQVEEMILCSLQGEILHEWQCASPNGRVGFLEFLSQKARHIVQGLPLGAFDRLEVNASGSRIVAQIQADRALFVRTSQIPQPASSPAQP